NEKLIDSLGFYDPDLPKSEKERIVDSIYNSSKIQYSETRYQNFGKEQLTRNNKKQIDSAEIKTKQKIQAKELGLEHQLFFAASPRANDSATLGKTDETIYVVVDGDQIVKIKTRLRMRLTKAATINNRVIPKNTLVFGFISFQPNRALIN